MASTHEPDIPNGAGGDTVDAGDGAAGGTLAGSHDELVDALLAVSRVIVAVAARSLADLDAEVTLPQFRAMTVLAGRGPQRVVDISAELGVNPSTGTRMCERLLRKGLIRRDRATVDRREVRLALTSVGEGIVAEVTRRRRVELTKLVDSVPARWHAAAIGMLRSLTAAAGEPNADEWWLGWNAGGAAAATGMRASAPAFRPGVKARAGRVAKARAVP